VHFASSTTRFSQYQIILLGDRGNRVWETLPQIFTQQHCGGWERIASASLTSYLHTAGHMRWQCLCPLAWHRGADHFQTGDTDVSMHQRDCPWLPISRRETSRRCTRPQTPKLSCVILTCHSSYPMFYNWWLCLHCRSCLCLEQASSRNQICHVTTCFQTSTENSSFRSCLTPVKWLKFFPWKHLSL